MGCVAHWIPLTQNPWTDHPCVKYWAQEAVKTPDTPGHEGHGIGYTAISWIYLYLGPSTQEFFRASLFASHDMSGHDIGRTI